MQWYFKALKPWVHYIPIDVVSEEHLKERLIWAMTHDEEAKNISKASTELCDEIFSNQSIELYIRTLLENYAKLVYSE